MSLSNPTVSQNPAEKFIEWKGSEGYFAYYDKEKKENIKLNTPLYIIALDQLSTITGYSDKHQSGIWSNEVKYTKEEELIVKTKSGVIAKGLYRDIESSIKSAGAKYAKSVFAVLISGNKENTELELVNFKFSGASLEPFINAKIGDGGEVILLEKNQEPQKKGSNTYFIPKITKLEVRQDILQKAIDLDKELQEYFKNYLGSSFEVSEVVKQQTENQTMPEINVDDINVQMPF